VIEIVTRNNIYDYEAKYKNPDTQYLVPAPIDEKARAQASRLAGAAHKALGCISFSRVDMMMDEKGSMFVLEVNTIPGMTERSLLPKAAQAIGLPFSRLCVKILENALRRSG
jgi:D-alanine-D-alanine ligase